MKPILRKSTLQANATKAVLMSLMVSTQFQFNYAQAEQSYERDTIYFTLPPSPDVLASHLFGTENPRPLTRSLSFKSNIAAAPTEVARSVMMPILFHFGQTTITAESEPFLKNVGKMLSSPEHITRRMMVEGHTDAVGSSEYNYALSEMRATAIKQYLVSNFGVNPDRLHSVGKGESLLYNTSNPGSGENRRVEFLPIAES